MVAVFHLCPDSSPSLSVIGAERPLSNDGCFNGGGSHGNGEGERRSGETRGRRRLGENAAALGQHGECVTLCNLTRTHRVSYREHTSCTWCQTNRTYAHSTTWRTPSPAGNIRAQKKSTRNLTNLMEHDSISSSYKCASWTRVHTSHTHPSQ